VAERDILNVEQQALSPSLRNFASARLERNAKNDTSHYRNSISKHLQQKRFEPGNTQHAISSLYPQKDSSIYSERSVQARN
jgi:hypothetical protein